MAVRGDSLVYCRRPAGLGKATVSAGLSHPLYCRTHKDTQTERCGKERECAGEWYSAVTSTRGQHDSFVHLFPVLDLRKEIPSEQDTTVPKGWGCSSKK